MGVSGSGKTTIGEKLAGVLGLPFYDADNFHPQANIEKMTSGTPLTDDDRLPWLEELAKNIKLWNNGPGAVLACSALKEEYRTILRDGIPVSWIYLHGSRDMIQQRLESRRGHYMSTALLNSQLETLEKPAYGIHTDISGSADEIVREIIIKIDNMKAACDFGIIGLGVMGKSLALNLAGKGVRVAVYNRHVPGKEEGIAEAMVSGNTETCNLMGFDKLEEFVRALERPRKMLLMIYAGAVDIQIEELLPFLEAGDVIIDGGNSFYRDTSRRAVALEERGIYYLGTGISGGEEGARKGPSVMAGGSKRAYELSGKYLELIAARNQQGVICAAYVGPNGAGHFVKMVHNGIEYAEMQLLAEVYHLLRHLLKLSPEEIVSVFSDWQKGGLDSYLLEITIEILQKKEDGKLLIDSILDQAEQKGTGGLSVGAALEYGVPYGSLSEAVMARALSAMKNKRIGASGMYKQEQLVGEINKPEFISGLMNAYKACRIINHEIGFNLMTEASAQNKWDLKLNEIAAIWTNGCIIRSALMNELAVILSRNDSILIAPEIVPVMKDAQKDFAEIVSLGLRNNFSLPVLSAALNYFLGFITAESPANLIQAQRDYFGAHTYRKKDKPADQYFHTNWKPL